MSKAGIIYVSVRADVAEEKDFHVTMDETDYEFSHPLVSHTEIKSVNDDTRTLTVALYLEADQDDDGMNEIVSDLDYNFSDPAIVSTEIVEASFEFSDNS